MARIFKDGHLDLGTDYNWKNISTMQNGKLGLLDSGLANGTIYWVDGFLGSATYTTADASNEYHHRVDTEGMIVASAGLTKGTYEGNYFGSVTNSMG